MFTTSQYARSYALGDLCDFDVYQKASDQKHL